PATGPPSLMILKIVSSLTSRILVQSVRSPGLVTSVAAAGPSPFADAPWHLTHRESNLPFAAAKSCAMHGPVAANSRAPAIVRLAAVIANRFTLSPVAGSAQRAQTARASLPCPS